MAIFPTITQQELESVGVVGLPDTPSMTRPGHAGKI